MDAKDIPRQYCVKRIIEERKTSRLNRLIIENRAGIYVILNRRNNHKYVGQAVDLLKRKKYHFSALKSGTHSSKYLQGSYNIHGESAFIFIVLEYVRNLSEITDREQFWINELKPEYNAIVDLSLPYSSLYSKKMDTTDELICIKIGEDFERPPWHTWVYGASKNPLLSVGTRPKK